MIHSLPRSIWRSIRYLNCCRVRFWDLGGWILHSQTSTESEKFLYMISRVLRAVSCYVYKVIRKWIAVFSSGFTMSLLYVKRQLSYREIYQPNWQIPFKLRYWKGVSTQQERPFPSSLVPLFQSESKCETILMKMTLICMRMKLHAKLIFIRKVSHLDCCWLRLQTT